MERLSDRGSIYSSGPWRRLLIVLAASAVACGPAPSVEAFRDEAVPVLSRQDLGDDPTLMQGQMDDLSSAMDLLPEDQSAELVAQVDALNGELDLAAQGQDDSGWSNADVVETVGLLCGPEDLVSWTVQP